MWSDRHAKDQWPAPSPPFPAMGGAVRLHIGCVDCNRRINPSHIDERSEDSLPDVPSRPAVEAIVDRCARSIDRGTISPPAPTLENMHDATDHAPIIDTPGAGLVLR